MLQKIQTLVVCALWTKTLNKLIRLWWHYFKYIVNTWSVSLCHGADPWGARNPRVSIQCPAKIHYLCEIVDVNFRMKATLCKNKNGYGNKYSLVLTLLLSLLSDSYERTVTTGRRVSQFGEMSMTSETRTVELGSFWGFQSRKPGQTELMFKLRWLLFFYLVYFIW